MEKRKQTDRVLDFMRVHNGITTKDAFEHLGITRLSARIWDLRHDGVNIQEIKETGKNRFGESTTYTRYYLGELV